MKRTAPLALAGLAACATPYAPTPYDREAAQVRRIAMMDDALPERAGAYQATSTGQNVASSTAAASPIGGLVVGLVVAGAEAKVASDRRGKIADALEAAGYDPEAALERSLDEALEAAGYDVTLTGEARRKRALRDAYPAADDADAVLDVVAVSFGYMKTGGAQPWRPHANVHVRLVDAADPTVILMDNRVAYNPLGTPENVIVVPADPAFAFETVDEMKEAPEKTRDGLQHAVDSVAATVGTLLK